MLKNNGKITIQRSFLLILCVICLIFTSFGISMENSYAVDLNETMDDGGNVLDSDVKLENSHNNEILEANNQLINPTPLGPSGGTFKDIQDYINDAAEGGAVFLSGTYTPTAANQQIQINKRLTIISWYGATLDGKGISSIFKITAPNTVIMNLKFINGKANEGAAIWVGAKNVKIDNCTFENNHANIVAGAIYAGQNVDQCENFKIHNCNFTNNHAYRNDLREFAAAGAVGAFSMNTELYNCIFDSNYVKTNNADCFGGALQIGTDVPNYYASIKKCVFKNNKAISMINAAHGGAGCVRNGVNYEDCTFINNVADQGGALTMHASGIINKCTFIENKATSQYGGAISTGFLYDSMVLNIVECDFDGNTAPLGGAIQAKGLNVNIIDSDFKNNHATQNGGAVNIQATDSKVDNSRFNYNTADIDGGAIYIKGTNTQITGSSFIANQAIPDHDKLDDGLGGAVYINSNEATLLRNNFVYNTARNGSAIYYDAFGNQLTLIGNVLYQNQAWVYQLPIYSQDIYYGDSEEIKVFIHGGNNIGKYNNLAVSNAIYNAANNDEIDIDGQTPVNGATNDGRLYQDDRENNIAILLTVNHEDGTVIYDKSLNSSYLGEINVTFNDLRPGKYYVTAKHLEDTYYKGITNVTTFMVYPKVDNKITITTNDSEYKFEDVVVWTVNITNLGPNDSTEVIAYDIIPDGLILINHDCGSKYDPKTGVLNISTLNVGEELTYHFTTIVDKTGYITSKVNITAKETDVNLTNNHDEKTIHIDPAADLAVVKTVSDNVPNYLDHITWTITVTNNGPDIAHNVTVNDVLPKTLIYVDCDGDYDVETGIWNIGTLNNGKTIRLNINCIINETGLAQNNVTVNGSEYDYDLTNNYNEELIYVNKAADLSIVKSVNQSTVNYHDLVKWTLTVSNKGPDNATNVIITDVLPEGFVYISSSVKYENNTVIIDKLRIGQSITVELITLVNITGNHINIANVTSDEYDYNLTDNQDDEPIKVNPASDLEVTKTASDPNPQYHDEVTWEIIVTNNGPDTAHNIIIKDVLPESLVWLDDDSEGQYDPVTGELHLSILEVGESFTFNIDCLVNATGLIQNNVSVNGSEYDHNITNNEANDTIDVERSADVSIVKLVNQSNPNYNDLVKWTLIIKNNGPDKANEIHVDEVLPEGVIFVSWNATKGFFDYSKGYWVMCCLEKGEEQRIDIITRVNKTRNITNIATIHADEYDIDLTNNEDNETIDVPLAVDVGVTIDVNNTEPLFGETVKWIITVTNNGPDNATGVVLNELLPEEVIFTDYKSTKGVYADGKWIIGTLNVGETQNLNISTISNALGEIINNVNVESEEYDWNKSNNNDDSLINVKPVADLSITKTVDNPKPKYNEKVKWTITVTNNGPNMANNVKVFETLPEGLKIIKSNGNYKNGIWNVGNLNNGESKELVITCRVTSTGDMVNKVNVVSDEHDPDLTNNDAFKTINVPPASDLSITKIASKYKYVKGEIIEYTIEVVNNGPDTARNIKVKDILDDLLKLKSFKTTMGKFDKNKLLWTIDSLGYGESAILTVRAIAVGSGILKNTVTVTSDTFDYDLSNNKDYAVVNVSEKPSKDLPDNPGNHFEGKSLSNLERHPTANPFWNLILALVLSLVFLSGNRMKR